MAFVSDDDIESVNRNVELLSIFVDWFVADVEDCIATEEIDRHPLNRADINEGIALLWIVQIGLRQYLRIKLVFFLEIFALKALTVDFVNLVELESWLRLKRSKGANGLCRECSAIN